MGHVPFLVRLQGDPDHNLQENDNTDGQRGIGDRLHDILRKSIRNQCLRILQLFVNPPVRPGQHARDRIIRRAHDKQHPHRKGVEDRQRDDADRQLRRRRRARPHHHHVRVDGGGRRDPARMDLKGEPQEPEFRPRLIGGGVILRIQEPQQGGPDEHHAHQRSRHDFQCKERGPGHLRETREDVPVAHSLNDHGMRAVLREQLDDGEDALCDENDAPDTKGGTLRGDEGLVFQGERFVAGPGSQPVHDADPVGHEDVEHEDHRVENVQSSDGVRRFG
mmetsp:Transcript_7846/g.16374  ORF Transcript_7846/g.16374 Transcript_7846/m.16374 type:complete len:277 (-) Transcript_7846:333-1163(-)